MGRSKNKGRADNIKWMRQKKHGETGNRRIITASLKNVKKPAPSPSREVIKTSCITDEFPKDVLMKERCLTRKLGGLKPFESKKQPREEKSILQQKLSAATALCTLTR